MFSMDIYDGESFRKALTIGSILNPDGPGVLFSSFTVFLFSCFPVFLFFLFSCFSVFLFSCFPVSLFSCVHVSLLCCFPVFLLNLFSFQIGFQGGSRHRLLAYMVRTPHRKVTKSPPQFPNIPISPFSQFSQFP